MLGIKLVDVWLHAFVSSALGGGEWSPSPSGHFTAPRKGS